MDIMDPLRVLSGVRTLADYIVILADNRDTMFPCQFAHPIKLR